MRAWLAHHGHSLVAACARFLHTPLGSAFNILVIGFALSLPLALYVVIDNLQSAAHRLASEPQVSLFMAVDASAAEVAQIEARLKQNPRVLKFQFVPRQQALRDLRQSSGLGDVVDQLPENPLPDAYVITAKDSTPQALEALRDEVRQWPRVAHVQLDASWARRLDALLRLGRLTIVILGGLLALALIAITFNTIRLQVLTRRDEIEVITLIGATDAFIRRPFLYHGALQGFAGGLVAWLGVSGGIRLLNHNLGELSHLYASQFEFKYLTLEATLLLLIVPSLLGWLGARLSVSRHLRAARAGTW